MDKVDQRRNDIYNYFHSNAACQQYFHDAANKGMFVAYYNSMYLLQDSTESLWVHRQRGFATIPLFAYLEFWGVMQAVIIQQDSIAEIFEVVAGRQLDAKNLNLKAWLEVRNLRNICAGHPVKKSLPKSLPVTRSFMGRSFGDYNEITYEQWVQGVGTTHPRIKLGDLLDAYAREVEGQLLTILATMKSRWP